MAAISQKSQTYIFDLQTIYTFDDVGGKKFIEKMGISFAAFLNYETQQLSLFNQEQIEQVLELLHSAALIVGVNLSQFSLKLVEAFTKTDLTTINALDIIKDIKKKIHYKPDAVDIFMPTVGVRFDCDYLHIPRLLRLGKNDEAKYFFIQSVQHIYQLYRFGKNKGFIYFNDRTGQRWKISVDW